MTRLGLLPLATLLAFPLSLSAALCTGCGESSDDARTDAPAPAGGKADDAAAENRQWTTLLTAPHCDVCTQADKNHLLEQSVIVSRLIELIDNAEASVEIAQFTWSNRDIEAAVLRAHQKPEVDVRVVMNSAQENGDTVANRLKAAGVDVEFVKGKKVEKKDGTHFFGLQHAKFMVVDDDTLVMGSNNWSSTGMSINDENTLVLESVPEDPLLVAFNCYYEMAFEGDLDSAGTCSTDEVKFTPSSAPFKMLRDEIRAATTSIDVLMHHLNNQDLVKELKKAAENDVAVRVIVNEMDRGAVQGKRWDELRAAGGKVRFKQTNPDLSQFMHDKLVIIDGEHTINGSGNWSGAFFNNYEFYVDIDDDAVVDPLVAEFTKLWNWSRSAESVDAGLTAAQQDAQLNRAFFGNLHAHYSHPTADRHLDDGVLEREVDGELIDVSDEVVDGDTARHAFEYARDEGELDFMALSPHSVDERVEDPPDLANMTEDGFLQMLQTARAVTEESEGGFLAMAGAEWSTNSSGNHLGVVGITEIPKVPRGDFAEMWDGWLPERVSAGDRPVVALNHPRTFRHFEGSLGGSWDQIFGVDLLEIPKTGQRNKKFNDFGLDDYPPLSEVWDSWIAGEAMPDRAVVDETLANVYAAAHPYAKLMEVTVNRGKDLRGVGRSNPSLNEEEDGTFDRFVKVHSDWDYYLLHGWELAPIASHDNHFANWGTGHSSRTVVLAPTLDEANVLAALGDRAVYASEDENLEVRLYAEDRVRAGRSLVTIDDTVSLDLFVQDPDLDPDLDGVVATLFVGRVGDESVVEVDDRDIDLETWTDLEIDVPEPGRWFVYVQVHQADPDRMAWTAPVFIDRR